jgi:release factor glutamine methyltransferase
MNLRDAARAVRQRLEHAGVPDADIEAELLAREAAGGIDRVRYFAGFEANGDVMLKLDKLVARRLWREPFAYISGTRDFYGLEFGVNSAVLIPRPESEMLVEHALAFLKERPNSWVVDVGTGSGCLAVSMEVNRDVKGRTAGCDLSASAVAVARNNASRHDAGVHFFRGSLASAVRYADLVVANLPYIPSADVDALEPELRDWEPRLALDGGESGTSLIHDLLDDCASRLRPRMILLECGMGQAQGLAAYATKLGFVANTYPDLARIERVVECRLLEP